MHWKNNGNKYLTLVSVDKNKEVLTILTQNFGIKLIETINGKPGNYDEKYMKIKFNSDDYFALQEDKKYYPQIFLDECLYEL